MKPRILPLIAIIVFFANGCANAGVADWFYGRSWEFMESVGGIAIGMPLRTTKRTVFLPVTCDVSGLTSISKKPTLVNSALVVTGIDKKIEGKQILISVNTGLASNSKTSTCSGVELGDIPSGDYHVFYSGSDRQKHPLGKVIVPQG